MTINVLPHGGSYGSLGGIPDLPIPWQILRTGSISFPTEPISLALYQPDIPQNCGTMLRLTACMGLRTHIIEPCGFVWDDKKLKRAGMDYLEDAPPIRHRSWRTFLNNKPENSRLILMTTKATEPYVDMTFQRGDILLMGSESTGVPEEVHQTVDHRLTIPMASGMRSLNVAISAGMVLGEALRQLNAFPEAQQRSEKEPSS